jgi:hypothetical protein
MSKPHSRSRGTKASRHSTPSTAMPLLVQILPQLPPPASAAALGVTTIHSGRQQEQQQQKLHGRQRRRYLAATAFWKLGVPIVLLYSAFTLMDRLGRDIQGMYNVQPTTSTTREKQDMLFDYSSPTLSSNTTLKDPTADYSAAETIVFVLSARANFQRRSVIRQTWGHGHAVYFVIGGQPPPEPRMSLQHMVQYRLVQEQDKYQDLIDSIHPEAYRSLPHKLVFAYQWILQRWLQVQWLVKVDDDSVARIDTLQRVGLNQLNPAYPIVAGRIMVDEPVLRQGKWAEVLYPESRYPYWPQGSCGHAVSRPVAAYVAEKSTRNKLTLYQGEDTSLGIWLHYAAVAKELQVTWFHSQYFTNTGKCEDRQWLIIGHRISSAQMKACYKMADEWPDDYAQDIRKHLWYTETAEQKQKNQWWRRLFRIE